MRMMTTDFAGAAAAFGIGVPAAWLDSQALAGENAALLASSVLGPEGAVLLGVVRGGAVLTALGAASIAVLVRRERGIAGGLVAILVVALLAQAQWSIRQVSVQVDLARPREAGMLLRDLLPVAMDERADGSTLMLDADGAVRAEIRVRSGWLAADAVGARLAA